MAIASGTCGTCTWTISDAGELSIRPTSGNSGYLLSGWMVTNWPWQDYAEEVRSAVFGGSIYFYEEQFSGQQPIETGNALYLFKAVDGFIASETQYSNLTSITGFGSLKNLVNISEMFGGCTALTTLDLSSLDTTNVTRMTGMFDDCNLLSSVTFGSLFSTENVEQNEYPYFGKGTNTTNGIVVQGDADFMRLTVSQRAGTWERGVVPSYSAVAFRTAGGVPDTSGEDVEIDVTWATDASTTTRTLKIYKKLSSTASYPSTAEVTRTLSGNSGIESITLADVGSEAYDFKVEFYDGTNTFITFPAVQANIELIVVSKTGDVKIAGDLFMRGKIQTDDQILVKTNIDSTTHPSSALYPKLIELQDADGLPIGYVEGALLTNGQNGVSLTAKKMVSDVAKYNYLRLLVDDAGEPVVQIGNSAAWRTGLGLGGLATKSSVTPTTVAKTFSKVHSSAQASGNVFTVSISCTADTGYKPIAVTGVYCNGTGTGAVYLRGFNMNGYNAGPTEFTVDTYWRASGSISAKAMTAYVEILTMKTSLS